MVLYDPSFVDESLKTKLLEMLAQYNSLAVCWGMGEVAVNIIRSCSVEEDYSSDSLELLYKHQNDDRFLILDFYKLLEKEIYLDSSFTRLSNGRKKLKHEFLPKIILPHLQSLPYPTQINSWLAVCEKWLQICNADWILIPAENAQTVIREEEIAKWICSWIWSMYWFY